MKFGLLTLFAFLRCIQAMKRTRSPSKDDRIDKKTEVATLTLTGMPNDLLATILFLVAIETPNHLVKGYYNLVSKMLHSLLESPYFVGLIRLHPATRLPILLHQKTFNLASDKDVFDLVKPELNSTTLSKLVQKAVGTAEIEALMEISQPESQLGYPRHAYFSDVVGVEFPEMFIDPPFERVFVSPDGKRLASTESFLSTLKSLATEDLSERSGLGPAYLMVIDEFLSNWKNPSYKAQLQDFIFRLSSLKLWPVQKITCVMKLLIIPLILATLSDEKAFTRILPEHFFVNQIEINTSEGLRRTLVYLNEYFQDNAPTINDRVLEYIHLYVQDYNLGFTGFNGEILRLRLGAMSQHYDRRSYTAHYLLNAEYNRHK